MGKRMDVLTNQLEQDKLDWVALNPSELAT